MNQQDSTSLCDVKSLIEFQASRRGEQVFLIDPSKRRKITYRDLLNLVQHIASNVRSLGARPGDNIAYALSNGSDCAIVILALLYGGYRATAVNLVAGPGTIAHVLEHSQSKFVITQPAHVQLLDQSLGSKTDLLPKLYPNQLLSRPVNGFANDNSKTISESDDGLLMYTSGTTGKPKGVVLTHGNLVAGGNNAAIAHELSPQDRALCVLPLYHINGLCVTLMGPLVSGGSVVLPEKFSASSFWHQVGADNCSWFSVVPTQISYLLHEKNSKNAMDMNLEKVRFGRSASAPLSPDVQTAFEKRFGIPIIETMGLTETAAQILSNPLPPGTRKTGSPGIPVGNEVIIADKNQKELKPGQEGEILVRGPNVMRMYLKDAAATKSSLTPDRWFRTGDLGRMDEDGYFFVTGRLRELIIKGGENIAPREIDEALYAHGDVIEAAAFACPCENYGQTIQAAVKVNARSQVSENELLEFCRHRLGQVKTPDRIHFLQELPKGPSGKIQRSKIIDIL
ncbi:Long-chain-fatty-acid--CoA ligase [hydrothermal vent metagenome]|uniref:Long-chain-fatty-acid--CoA ligase n=1 Tax=hydrothermal vent metagenome TaxID=652676 RepID=A0A3B0RER6_9ZZZZ